MPVFELGWTGWEWAGPASLWAIRLALACMVVRYGWLLSTLRRSDVSEQVASPLSLHALDSSPQPWSEWIWLAGAVLAFAHTLSALAVFHGWSHRQAVLATEAQTEALLGIRVGAGVIVNYIFVAVWLIDAMWLLAASHAWLPRPPKAWSIAAHAFLIFIAINGAIVFAQGPVRWISLAALVTLLVAWVRLLRMPAIAEAERSSRQ
ncbi:MAG: hypothetical protein ACK5OB_00195 [Pirellula sp.]